jgi:hypothetical protein
MARIAAASSCQRPLEAALAVGYRGMRRTAEAVVLGVAVSAGGAKSGVRAKRKSQQQAAWKTALEGAPKRMRLQEHSTVSDLLFSGGKWGQRKMEASPTRATRSKARVPKGETFEEFALALCRDFAWSTRSEKTWKAYSAWVDCFLAFLEVFGVDRRPAPDNFRIWSTALAVASAVLALLYSTGTLEVFTAAVIAFMQDSGMPSPWSDRVFKMVFEGVKR